ncbi:hypothetical protein AXF42_Ash018345 [Apostasia shenzhenica]|uniref:Uncharacterized protein n=1 Tax=Apostasia shenzhenica TaxID=1088818 RepID=A0A2H9ZR68_9ASPA|nr:hypothetical protein AXF42_Ash018345 [Apostasia shenzhenica]
MRSINRKMRALESENMHLKEECRNHIVLLEDKIQKARNALENLNVKTQTGTKLSEWREMEIQDTQNLQIFKVPEDDILESNKVKLVREKLENLLLTEEHALKSTEISRLRRLNELLEEELHKMHNKVENLRMKENLTSTSERNAQESKRRKEVAVLLQDLHASSILAMVLEEAVMGLMQTIKGLETEILQLRMALQEEIALRTSHNGDFKEKLDVLERKNVKLKAELNAYLPIVVSLDKMILPLWRNTPFL